MRIAFDVKGTIEGPQKEKVLRLFRAFEKQGHEMIVWSSLYAYATGAVAKYGLNAQAQSKVWSSESSPDQRMDVAIDDEPQTWLATNRLILVADLPDDVEGFAAELTANHSVVDGGIRA